MRRWFLVALLAQGALVAIFPLADLRIRRSAEGRLYSRIDEVPERPVALVLGTAAKVADGRDNLFFKFRVRAAADLYHAGKVRHVLVSGDNGNRSYDEATDMRDALIALGVPEAAIVRDHAGFRTLDSVIRCKRVFGQEAVTIVSQRFHNERALYIARHEGMDAVAYCARDVAVSASPATYVREYFARVMALLDVHLLNRAPRYLGEPVRVGGVRQPPARREF